MSYIHSYSFSSTMNLLFLVLLKPSPIFLLNHILSVGIVSLQLGLFIHFSNHECLIPTEFIYSLRVFIIPMNNIHPLRVIELRFISFGWSCLSPTQRTSIGSCLTPQHNLSLGCLDHFFSENELSDPMTIHSYAKYIKVWLVIILPQFINQSINLFINVQLGYIIKFKDFVTK